MGWKDHFKCQVTVFARGVQHTWTSELPVPDQIPLKLVLLKQTPFYQHSKTSKRSLSLEHRKALWVYQNTHPAVWAELLEQFTHWMQAFASQGAIELEVFEAATPVVLKFLSQTKIKAKITVRVHKAPLAWLESEFVKTRKKNISLRQISSPDCLWASTPQLIGKLAA
jgi:hypothetical protein